MPTRRARACAQPKGCTMYNNSAYDNVTGYGIAAYDGAFYRLITEPVPAQNMCHLFEAKATRIDELEDEFGVIAYLVEFDAIPGSDLEFACETGDWESICDWDHASAVTELCEHELRVKYIGAHPLHPGN